MARAFVICFCQGWVRPCEKTGPKNQWFKPVISENKSLFGKKLITDLKKLSKKLFLGFHEKPPVIFILISGFW